MISKTAVHAVKAVMVLAGEHHDSFVGAAELARRIGAPPNYLGKLLQVLARAGVVRSQRGLGGGFQLARPAKRISLFDVVEPIDRVSQWSRCVMGQRRCSAEVGCVLHGSWIEVRDTYWHMLESCSVADMLARQRAARLEVVR